MKHENVKMKTTPQKRWKTERLLQRAWNCERGPEQDNGYEHLTNTEAALLLCRLANVHHPAVKLPKEGTLHALLRDNPREDFLRRLAASNN
jgi:hypothetical protein